MKAKNCEAKYWKSEIQWNISVDNFEMMREERNIKQDKKLCPKDTFQSVQEVTRRKSDDL